MEMKIKIGEDVAVDEDVDVVVDVDEDKFDLKYIKYFLTQKKIAEDLFLK